MKKIASLIVSLSLVLLLVVSIAGCSKGLTLTVWEPSDGATVTGSQVYVKGKVSNPKAIVTVNDKNTWKNTKTGEFQGTVALVEGENTIRVDATQGKKAITKTLTIIHQPEQ